ncbi:MAG TPA: RlpA-like double-psi beta-barrel domain-containing protein, partial [Actinomycetota bacterium]|nr:RlpA-like double-psi beta-barrel domain-containing protein [Actinomycetota bacterium]
HLEAPSRRVPGATLARHGREKSGDPCSHPGAAGSVPKVTSPYGLALPRRVSRPVALLLLTALSLVLPAYPHAAAADDLDAVRKRLADANAQTARVLNELKSIDSRIYSVNRSILRDEKEVGSAESRVRSAEASIRELDERIRVVRRSANARAVRMYKNGPGSILAPLFTSTTLTDLSKLGMFWESLAEKDGRTLNEANKLKAQRDEEKAALNATIRNLEARVKSLDAQRDNLAATKQQRTKSLGELKVAIQTAIDAEKRILAARAAAIKKPAPGPCTPGLPARDQRLAALLSWYSPATGGEGFMPSKLGPTGVVTSGDASWYGPGFDGCRSASGATFKASQMTAASVILPLGTILKVTRGGRGVVVVITDRGPYAHGRVLDLSQASAQAIGLGAGPVNMEILLPTEPAPPFP